MARREVTVAESGSTGCSIRPGPAPSCQLELQSQSGDCGTNGWSCHEDEEGNGRQAEDGRTRQTEDGRAGEAEGGSSNRPAETKDCADCRRDSCGSREVESVGSRSADKAV